MTQRPEFVKLVGIPVASRPNGFKVFVQRRIVGQQQRVTAMRGGPYGLFKLLFVANHPTSIDDRHGNQGCRNHGHAITGIIAAQAERSDHQHCPRQHGRPR